MPTFLFPDTYGTGGPAAVRPGARGVVAAMFVERLQAQKAINDLKNAGFASDGIGLALRDQDAQAQLQAETGTHATEGAGVGVATGGLLGGLGGLLVGIGALAIPGIGPVIAGGALASALGVGGATALAGAGIGAATGGIVGALVGAGLPETEARRLHEGFERGAVLVTVKAGEGRAAEAEAILRGYGGDLGREDGSTTSKTTAPATSAPLHSAAVDTEVAGRVQPPSPVAGASTTEPYPHRLRDEDTGSRMTI